MKRKTTYLIEQKIMLYRSQLSHKIILQWKQYNVHTRLVNNAKQVPLRQYHITNNIMGIPENVKDKRESILEEKQRIPPSLWQDWGAHHWQSHKQILHTQDNDGLSQSSLISYFQMQEPIHKVQLIIWTDVELKQTPRSLLFLFPSLHTNKQNKFAMETKQICNGYTTEPEHGAHILSWRLDIFLSSKLSQLYLQGS